MSDTVKINIDGKEYESAWGRSKKEAEQRAAANALSEICGEQVPHPSE